MSSFKKIILSLLFAYIICYVFFEFADYEIKKYECHKTGRLQEIFYKKTDYNVLFLGSSRTHLMINPKMIDSICHVNSYNAGVEGGNLFEFEVILESYLQNHPAPKWLILTIDLHSFISKVKFFNYSAYLSYTKNKVVEKYLNENGYHTWYLTFFPFLKMADYDDDTKGNILKGFLNKTEIVAGGFQYKGYKSNTDEQITSDTNSISPVHYEVSNCRKQNLCNIISLCKSRGINIIFTYAPEYKHKIIQMTLNSRDIFGTIDSVARINNIPVIRDDSLAICNNPKLFANLGHLNRVGSDIYSQILANNLNTLFKTKFYNSK